MSSISSFPYTENPTDHSNNTPARDIETFISNTNKKGGYYLARYEASYGGKDKPLSKPSIGTPERYGGEQYAPSTNSQIGQLWSNITQPNAAIAARNMYAENDNYESDLTNSYAWDTAIMFIQKYAEGKENYSNETGKGHNSGKNKPDNTGERTIGVTTDKVCNIYDMASNCFEWTTEISTLSGGDFCTLRGGECSSNLRVQSRSDEDIYFAYQTFSFRTCIYVKLKN